MGFLENDVVRNLAGFGCDALFNTYCFLVIFLPLTVIGYWLMPRRLRLGWLVLASLVFYGFWDARFIVLLVASAVVDYLVALRIAQTRRRAWLWTSIGFNLGMLAFWKYALFAADNARTLLGLVGIPVDIPGFNIVLPVGISFYTFQTLSYTIDVYRGRVDATRDFVAYLAYVTLFPQLVAGPIVRYRDMEDQLRDLPARVPWDALGLGVSLFVIGLAKKVLVADTVASWSAPFWGAGALTTAGAWTAALGYTVQLYFDFSGYSDMAIGLGAMMGFRYPVNFDAPYQARNPSDFWRRWHISLSTFLRDYLYIPLGGNRQGPRRTGINLFIVMLLGGLWHGAAWTFVVWGAYHGLLLLLYRRWSTAWDALPRAVQRIGMLLLVIIGWVPFRAPDLATAGHVLSTMIIPTPGPFSWALAGILATLAFTTIAKPTSRFVHRPTTVRAAWISALALVCLVRIGGGDSPFLYYQF